MSTTTSIQELLARVERAGLALYIADGRLRVRGPKEAMTPDLDRELREHKDAIKAALLAPKTDGNPGVAARVAAGLSEIDEGAIAKAHETKSTVSGRKPPLQEVIEQQEWLASVDWSQGLRCGITKQQCRVCRGVPCQGSTEWGAE